MDPLAVAIMRTVCFADALGAALTPVEIHNWLGIDCGCAATFSAVCAALETDQVLRSHLVFQDGFVAVRGRAELVSLRLERLAVAEEKWVIALRAMRRIRHVPWVHFAAVCNTVAMGLPRRESDIDIFLITEPGRLWAVRLLVHALLAPRSLARRGSVVQDRICVSFSVTKKATALAPVLKRPADPYMAIWLLTLAPVVEKNGMAAALWAANPWLVAQIPNAAAKRSAPARTLAPSTIARLVERFCGGPLGALINRAARRVQYPRILSHRKSLVHGNGTDVVVSDDMLKFHEADRRDAIREAFYERAHRYGV